MVSATLFPASGVGGCLREGSPDGHGGPAECGTDGYITVTQQVQFTCIKDDAHTEWSDTRQILSPPNCLRPPPESTDRHVRRVLLSAREAKPALGVGETPLGSGGQVRAALNRPTGTAGANQDGRSSAIASYCGDDAGYAAVDRSRTCLRRSRSLRFARRIAAATIGPESFAKPAGSPRLRSVIRVTPSTMSSHT
jgi:hypothetical protein